MKKRLLLSAYLRTNPGDDMMVLTLLKRYPHASFTVYCHPRHRACFHGIKNARLVPAFMYYADRLLLRLIRREPFRRLLAKLSEVIQIGGSMYIEPARFDPKNQPFRLKPRFIIGANFGPYRTQLYFDHVRSLLEQAEDVCFRDVASAKLFSQLPQVRQAPDVLFGYRDYPEPQAGKGIGISIIDPTQRDELAACAQQYFETLARFIELCREKEIPVTLLSFCEEEGDSNALEQIGRYTDTSFCSTFVYKGDPHQLLQTMNSCECLLATRFHAMIIGWMLQKKVLPILYSNKQRTVLEDACYTGPVWDLLNGQTYTPQALLSDCQSSTPLQNVRELAQASCRQFMKTDEFMQK